MAGGRPHGCMARRNININININIIWFTAGVKFNLYKSVTIYAQAYPSSLAAPIFGSRRPSPFLLLEDPYPGDLEAVRVFAGGLCVGSLRQSNTCWRAQRKKKKKLLGGADGLQTCPGGVMLDLIPTKTCQERQVNFYLFTTPLLPRERERGVLPGATRHRLLRHIPLFHPK